LINKFHQKKRSEYSSKERLSTNKYYDNKDSINNDEELFNKVNLENNLPELSKFENEKDQDSQNIFDINKKFGRINNNEPSIEINSISSEEKSKKNNLFIPSIEDQKYIASKNLTNKNMKNELFNGLSINNQNIEKNIG